MPAPVWLQSQGSIELHTAKVGSHTHLVTETHSRVGSFFKSGSLTDAGTVAIVTPSIGVALAVTDITISAIKLNGGTITVQFADGSNTEILYTGILTNNEINIHISYAGRRKGWSGARIDMVGVTSNIIADVSVGYYPFGGEGVLSYDDWNTERG